MLQEIGEALSRIPRSLRLYPNNESLHNSVRAIFESIFEFSVRAKSVFKMGRHRLSGRKTMNLVVSLTAALTLLWKPFEVQFGGIRDRIAKGVVDIETEAELAEKELAQAERTKDDIRWSKSEAADRLQAAYIDDQSWVKVTEWLSPANIATNHNAATKLRHGQSGTWFLESEAFQTWLKEDNSFLWLHAIPGAGKTVLASSIINYLQENVQSQSTGLAYFYCDYKDVQKQEPSKLLATLLASLAKQNRAVFDAVEKFFLQQYKTTSVFTAEFDELRTHFCSFITGHFESVIIVVDALDEAGPANWDCLAHAFVSLRQQCGLIKILVTSRNELPISRAFEELPRASIEESDIASDIRGYIMAELTAKISQRRLKLRSPDLEHKIREQLVQRSKGMFQWAKCQIEALCRLRNDKAIEAALENLPKTLHDTYLRILQRVEDDRPEDVDVVRNMLRWLVRGVRDMTLDELAEAVAIDPNDDATSMDFSAVDTDPEDILEVLGSLVTVSTDNYVSLAHYSVKEFLVSEDMMKHKPLFWIGHNEVEAQLASVCLTYLCYDDFAETKLPEVEHLEERLAEFKLYRYAAQAWAIHANRSEKEQRQPEEVVDLTMRLLHLRDDGYANFNSWVECYQHCNFDKQTRKRVARPMFVAAFFGLTEVATALLEETTNSREVADCLVVAAANGHAGVVQGFLEHSSAHPENNQDNDEGQSNGDVESLDQQSVEPQNRLQYQLQDQLPKALYAAAAKGHAPVVSLLLSHGAPINNRGGRDGTPLQAASLEGRWEVVKMLLENGANHSEANKRYGTPLSAAAEKAHQRTCDILLKHGANPNQSGGWYSLPLVAAIVGQNINIVRQLIDAGADLNRIACGRYGGPLPAAAAFGMNDLIKELVDRGARVNDDDDKASDALYAASLAGHVSTVDLLLKLGADVNAKGGRHRNALGVASAEGHLGIVEKLIDAGADLGFFDEHWGNAIHAAAEGGHVAVVEELADQGMNFHVETNGKGSALAVASAHGRDSVVETLLRLSAYYSGDTSEMTAALVAASAKGNCSTIELLVQHGANVNRLNVSSQTNHSKPLQAAAAKGQITAAKSLLALGADVTGVDEGWYGTALMAAVNAASDVQDLVTMILEAGADSNQISPSTSNFHGTPLAYAAKKNDAETTSILLAHGADANIVGASFRSPLMSAVLEDHDSMVDILMAHGADVNLIAEPLNLRGSIEKGMGDGTISALQTAAWFGQTDLVRKLFDLGAKLSVPNVDAQFTSALQAAAYRGHEDTVQALLELGSDPNERGSYFGSALQAASYRGETDVARILLDAGAIANEIDVGHFHSALLAACRDPDHDNVDLVKMLVERGADVRQKQKGPYPHVLQAVTEYISGEPAHSLIQFLVDKGADVNAAGGRYGTALQAAARHGQEDIVSLLLEKGADPNIVGGFYRTPLQAAYFHGYYTVIWKLYDHGARNDIVGGSRAGSAIGQGIYSKSWDGEDGGCCSTLLNQAYSRHSLDPNLEYGYYGNALQHAVMTRDMYDVLTIIRAGADINAIGGRFGTSLAAAAWNEDKETVDELLLQGADISIGNYRYPNAAFGAIRGNNKDALKLFIEKGVDVKTPSGRFGTTAQCAALLPRLSILRMVLHAGAEINTHASGLHGSPLQAALSTGNEQMVRYLIHRNADVRAKGGKFGGVMNTAVLTCGANIVELLVKKGADVNERGRVYGSPLQAAVCARRFDNVLVLLRHGADVNLCGGRYKTALQAACVGGQDLTVKLLIERGADPNIAGGRYSTALTAAAYYGGEKMARYLMEEAGAKWALVDRKRLSHIRSEWLDTVDETLLQAQKSMGATEKFQESGRTIDAVYAREGELTCKEEDAQRNKAPERNPLTWNVDSIPGSSDPYNPKPSKWTIVRDMSFHSFSNRSATIDSSDQLTSTNADTVGTASLARRISSLDRTGSGLSNRSGRSTPRHQNALSRATTLVSLNDTEAVKEWDGTALDWVQV